MSKRFQGGVLGVGFNPLQAPNAPTVSTLTITSGTSVAVGVTGSSNFGGAPVSNYVVISCPGAINGSSATSPVTVSGLTTGTAYTFRATVLNSYGPSPISAASSSITPIIQGQQAYTTAGTYTFVVPTGITSVSAVVVGGGGRGADNGGTNAASGGGGGGLGYKNNMTVTSGGSVTITVGAGGCTTTPNGGLSRFCGQGHTIQATGGLGGINARTGGTFSGTGVTGGTGGTGGAGAGTFNPGSGGAGAAGYAGNGGNGGVPGGNGTNGAGGGGGGAGGSGNYNVFPNYFQWGGGGGGGVGLLGQGPNGAGGARDSNNASIGGGAGSCGAAGSTAGNQFGYAGGLYGGGGGGGGYYVCQCVCSVSFGTGGVGRSGAVRVIWPGTTRSFPSTNTGNV